MVTELQSYYTNGLSVLSSYGHDITLRLPLSCISCDIPASRKVGGFLSDHANLGCNKCYKMFQVGSPNSPHHHDYFGYDRDTWELRTAGKHRSDCEKILSCKT